MREWVHLLQVKEKLEYRLNNFTRNTITYKKGKGKEVCGRMEVGNEEVALCVLFCFPCDPS